MDQIPLINNHRGSKWIGAVLGGVVVWFPYVAVRDEGDPNGSLANADRRG
ncbi:hypothetical protein [Halorubrum sp. HHNYT27]